MTKRFISICKVLTKCTVHAQYCAKQCNQYKGVDIPSHFNLQSNKGDTSMSNKIIIGLIRGLEIRVSVRIQGERHLTCKIKSLQSDSFFKILKGLLYIEEEINSFCFAARAEMRSTGGSCTETYQSQHFSKFIPQSINPSSYLLVSIPCSYKFSKHMQDIYIVHVILEFLWEIKMYMNPSQSYTKKDYLTLHN